MDNRFSFIILHYNSIEDTLACVDSIMNHCQNVDFRIYIVDNASPNGSGKMLFQEFKDSKQVVVVLSRDNLGFAKGNNLGIAKAIDDGYDDFAVVLNNDTKIIQSDFCQRIRKSYTNSNFAVLGPTIYTPLGKTHINPGRKHILKGWELSCRENFYKRGLKYIQKGNLFKYKILKKKMSVFERILSLGRPKFKYTENCILHGCCVVFSKTFFEKFSGFDDRTFLYFEEEILYAHVMNAGLKTVYDPAVEIWHKEDGSTDSVLGTGKEKTIFLYENILKSIAVYREVLEEYSQTMKDE